MTHPHLMSLQAGYVPVELLPDALPGWVGPCEWEWNGRWVMTTHAHQNPRVGATRLPLYRSECRQRIVMVMAAGLREPCERCTTAGEVCTRCRTGTEMDRPPWIRKSMPCRHLLPASELGALPDVYAAHAPTLIAAHVASVLTGDLGVRGLLREERQSTAGCYPDETRYELVDVTTQCGMYLAQVRTKRHKCDERAAKRAEALADGFALWLGGHLFVTWPEALPEKEA